LIIGFVFLTGGAHFLVEGSKNLALKFNIRPIVVGLTIVALATSFPELLVSLTSALKGSDGMAVGNVVGSNIANIALALALAAIIRPFKFEHKTLFIDFPVMLFITLIFCIFAWNRQLIWQEGVVLLTTLTAYIIYCVKASSHKNESNNAHAQGSKLKNLIFVLAGSAAVIGGAYLFVAGGIGIARSYNINEAVIGLTVIAIGTSLPELAATVTAAIKNQNEIGIGNIIGSNIFNFALVIGIVPCILALNKSGPLEFKQIMPVDIIMMLASVVVLYVIILLAKKFGRIAGLCFLIAYFVYIIYRYKTDII